LVLLGILARVEVLGFQDRKVTRDLLAFKDLLEQPVPLVRVVARDNQELLDSPELVEQKVSLVRKAF